MVGCDGGGSGSGGALGFGDQDVFPGNDALFECGQPVLDGLDFGRLRLQDRTVLLFQLEQPLDRRGALQQAARVEHRGDQAL